MSAHSVAVSITSADMEAVGLYQARRRMPLALAALGVMACVGIALAVMTGPHGYGIPLVIGAVGGLVATMFVTPYLAKRGLRRQYAQAFQRGSGYTVAWDDEILNIFNDHQTNKMRWSEIFAYRKTKDMVFLYWSSVSLFPIPLRSFTAEERDDFLRQFEINQVPQNPKRGRTATR